MNRQTKTLVGTLAAATLLASACTTSVADDPSETASAITQQATVSDCGGFARTTDASGSGDAPAYCDAEVLHWSYDRSTEKLSLTDSRIELNCCGLHDMTIERDGDVYVVTETDAPEMFDGMTARCGCMCVFDFGLAAEGIAEEVIQLRLIRHVTDSGAPTVVFEGSIDLGQGSGFEIVDEVPSMWCELDS